MRLGAIVAGALLCLAAPAAQTPFRVRTDVVTVDVLVKVGNVPVSGLTADDFELRDNGVVQQIDAISARTVPVDLTLLVDVSGSTRQLIETYKSDIRQVARLLWAEDRVRLLAFAGATARVFDFQAGSASVDVEGLSGGVYGTSGATGTALDDALMMALAWVPDVRRRHLIAAFTDGNENGSLIDRKDLIAGAARAPGLLYIALPQRVSGSREISANVWALSGYTHGHDTLQQVAESTGGGLIVSEKSARILDGFKTVFETFRAGYVLRYSPRGVRPEGWHEIGVSVTMAGKFEVRARKGYSGS